jgi:hypothetical protein
MNSKITKNGLSKFFKNLPNQQILPLEIFFF